MTTTRPGCVTYVSLSRRASPNSGPACVAVTVSFCRVHPPQQSQLKMSDSKPSAPRNITLHIWPKLGDSLAFDVSSVAALLCLQLAIPAQFSISYCANPDSSPTGTVLTVCLSCHSLLHAHRHPVLQAKYPS